MDIVDFYDEKFMQSDAYKNFVVKNPGVGYLNIRAYAANQAIPISGLKIIVSQEIEGLKVIFFEGFTDSSGTINKIGLPAPLVNENDLEAPKVSKYDIEAIYDKNKVDLLFKINIYPNILVIQNINIVPDVRLGDDIYGY